MPSVHVSRWIENLKDTNHELYWFDILDRGKLETLDSVQQFTGWKKRKVPYIKGEYFLSEKYIKDLNPTNPLGMVTESIFC